MQAEIERLKAQLIGLGEIEGTPILSVDTTTGIAILETIGEATARLGGHPADSYQPLLQMNVGAALLNFIAQTTQEGIEHSSFNTPQLTRIVGVGYVTIHVWFREKILVADGLCSTQRERRVSFTTAFAAGACGALRRYGVGIDAMRATANLIRRVGLPKQQREKMKV